MVTSGGDRLLLFYSELLGSIMHCISDSDLEIRQVAGHTDIELLDLVKHTTNDFELSPLLQTLTSELGSHHVPTRMAGRGVSSCRETEQRPTTGL